MQTFCMEAGVTAGAAAQAKMQLTTRNVSSELGWSCIYNTSVLSNLMVLGGKKKSSSASHVLPRM